MIKESGADIRQLKGFTKEEAHVWKPMPESAVIDFSQHNGYAWGTVGNAGNWPTGREGTSFKIVHLNNFMINNFRRLHACHQMGVLPAAGASFDMSEQKLRSYIFFGACKHKITLRNLEKQPHTLRVSKLLCRKNIPVELNPTHFAGNFPGHDVATNVSALFSVGPVNYTVDRSVERYCWDDFSLRQNVDDNPSHRAEQWLNPETRCASHPVISRHFKTLKTHTVRVAPGQSVTIEYRLPAKLVRYGTVLENRCLRGDIGMLMESWGDLCVLRSQTGSSTFADPPSDATEKPINMDFDSATLNYELAYTGLDYADSKYEETRNAVVRDHGEWAILHQYTIPMQFINWEKSPTILRHEYPPYQKAVLDSRYHQTFAPQVDINQADVAV